MNHQNRYQKRNKHIDNLISKYVFNDSFNIINFLASIILSFIMINLLLVLMKKIFGKSPPMNHIYVSKFNILYTTLCSLVLFASFIYLDFTKTSDIWNNCGPIVQISNTSNEPSKEGDFLLRKWNAHTSIALFSSGVFIILKTHELNNLKPKLINYSFTSYVLGILLVLLGLASYGWWGSKRYLLWRADHALMEGVNVYLILIILNSSGIFKNLNEKSIILGSFFIWAIRIFYMGQAKILYLIAICFASILFTIVYIRSLGRVNLLKYGILLILMGLFFKVADISNTVTSGTGWFHICISFGITLLWLWDMNLQIR